MKKGRQSSLSTIKKSATGKAAGTFETRTSGGFYARDMDLARGYPSAPLNDSLNFEGVVPKVFLNMSAKLEGSSYPTSIEI